MENRRKHLLACARSHIFQPLRLHKRHTTAKGDSRKPKADRLAEQAESRILTSFRQASGASPQPSPAYRAQFMVFTKFQQLGHVKIPTKIVSTGAVIFAPLQELGLLWRTVGVNQSERVDPDPSGEVAPHLQSSGIGIIVAS